MDSLTPAEIPHFKRNEIATAWRFILPQLGIEASWKGLRAFARNNKQKGEQLDRSLAVAFESHLLSQGGRECLNAFADL